MTEATQKGEKAPEGWALPRLLAAGILVMVVAMGIGRFAYTPILPAMRATFDLTSQVTSVLASSNYLGYLVGAVLTAVVALGSSQVAVVRASLVGVALTTGLMAVTTSFAAWAVLRFLAGVASAGAFVLASGIVLGVLNGRGRSDLSGWVYSGVGAGIALAGLIVLALGALPEDILAGWRADWIGLAAVAAVLVIPCWVWLPGSEGGGTIALAGGRPGGACDRPPFWRLFPRGTRLHR